MKSQSFEDGYRQGVATPVAAATRGRALREAITEDRRCGVLDVVDAQGLRDELAGIMFGLGLRECCPFCGRGPMRQERIGGHAEECPERPR